MSEPARRLPASRGPLQPYLTVQRATDRQVRRYLNDALAGVDEELKGLRSGIGGQVRRDQLNAVRSVLLREQAELFEKIGDLISAQRLEAAAAAAESAISANPKFAQQAGRRMGGDYAAALKEQARQAAALGRGRLDSTPKQLSRTVYRATAFNRGQVERYINGALARNLSARDFAKGVRALINPNVPGGVSYAANRLARTEINNAFHAAQIRMAQKNPWVTAMHWNLSGRHGKPDQCDQFAGGYDVDGNWPVNKVPGKPHPQCLCFLTEVTASNDDFLTALIAGKYDGYLAEVAS